jgi:hypothetical protein
MMPAGIRGSLSTPHETVSREAFEMILRSFILLVPTIGQMSSPGIKVKGAG